VITGFHAAVDLERLDRGVQALALAAGIAALGQHRDADRARALNRQITAVLAAPDARAATAAAPVPGRPGGTVTVVASRSLGKAVVTASRLRELPSGRTYQLWFLGAGPPRPSERFRTSRDRAVRPVVAAGMGGARRIGVTVEPAGGSSTPSAPPFVTLPLG
ncbi:anti-sigma factor, partial [Actinomadura roseirufa]|uniref:anti-sigma factor n=1 Tax=Actinomadura roseirufa TaxID=2094049 RepID=UPI0013F16324